MPLVQASLPVNQQGLVQSTTTLTSGDQKATVTVAQGTTALTATDQPLQQITVQPFVEPTPSAPADQQVIGLPYDFGPAGATFDPPITIFLQVAAGQIPPGVDPQSLVLARYDAATGQWVQLTNNSVVYNPATDTYTISAQTDHFTLFAVLTKAAPAPPPPLKPVWERWWFWVIIVGGVLLLTYIVWRIRRYQIPSLLSFYRQWKRNK